MTTWNYRIVRHHKPAEWLGLHEVYYDEDGNPNALTAQPISFSCDPDEGPGGIVGSLEMALADARERPILDRSEIGDDARPSGLKREASSVFGMLKRPGEPARSVEEIKEARASGWRGDGPSLGSMIAEIATRASAVANCKFDLNIGRGVGASAKSIGNAEQELAEAEKDLQTAVEAFDKRLTADRSSSAAIQARVMDGFLELWRKHRITTPELHREVLARCEQLMNAEAGTVGGIQLMALAILVEAYESTVFRPSDQDGKG